jgi:hypothetical protein
MTPEQIAKLPRAAREHIAKLERELEQATVRADELVQQCADYEARIAQPGKSRLLLGPNRLYGEPQTRPHLLPLETEVMLCDAAGKEWMSVRVDRDGSFCVQSHRDAVCVQPVASNAVKVSTAQKLAEEADASLTAREAQIAAMRPNVHRALTVLRQGRTLANEPARDAMLRAIDALTLKTEKAEK